ncbi:alpha/beta fold hydrolase [Streptomyces sp. H27-D2]|uniref:alpha/beta fold hydrolase n=1 Tax=Streptomyces sp. H27-D2 TaxID=3046304 RepID=UPI002DB98364|nr:alpha/beta fold hydrolase [Streptomyces sp. H27-D2]MEC4019377.1 alpha/beta fold hydrolase [Streptomyces sp. H27-D2]
MRQLSFGGFRYDCRVLWQRRGSAAPVLMLSGAAQDKYAWTRQEPRLSELGTVVTVDLPGWGASDVLPSHYGMDFLADAVGHTLTELGLGTVNVMGACYGGVIALRFAQRHPERLERLALVGTQHSLPDAARTAFQHGLDLLRRREQDKFAEGAVALFAPLRDAAVIRRRGAVARLLRRQFQQMSPDQVERFVANTERLLRHPLHGLGRAAAVPTLLVHGEHDRFTSVDHGRELAATLPGSRIAVVRNAGHMIPLERPDDFTDLLLRFFTDQSLDDLPYCSTQPCPPRSVAGTV